MSTSHTVFSPPSPQTSEWAVHAAEATERARRGLVREAALAQGDADDAADSDDDVSSQELRDATLALVMDRLARQPDFPSLGEALGGVRRVVRSERSRLQTLSEALLQDVGLANRVLRLANAAHYKSVGGGQITTLTRAIAVMGFTEIGQLAVSSRLIDQIRDKRQSLALREEFLRALLAGVMANELTSDRAQEEDAYLVAVFRNLGRLVACLHLSAEALKVRERVPRTLWPRSQAEEVASRQVLGVAYGPLGQAVAQRWGWPEPMRRALRHGEWALHRPTTRPEQLAVTGALANDLADMLIYCDPLAWDTHCEQLQREAGAASGHDARSMRAAMARARQRLEQLAQWLELPLAQLPAWQGSPDVAPAVAGSSAPVVAPAAPAPEQRAAKPTTPASTQAAVEAEADAAITTLAPSTALPAPLPAPMAIRPPAPAVVAAQLSDGVQDVVHALADGTDSGQIQAMIVEILLRSVGARRAVMCLRHGSSGDLIGRYGLGLGAAASHEHFVVPHADPHDLFSLLCARGADTMISDADETAIAARLPRWWRVHARARSLLILPMMMGRQCVGMLYADRPEPGALVVDDTAMKLLRTLRSQAVIAWKQGA
ncbi:MAG: hypothetical protein CFE46_10450 [Burkholderiales bacterium PBB6]|nr:MAG: hypothetical protein CFE46_10450 [Burkholderiales bacterium PBB6]